MGKMIGILMFCLCVWVGMEVYTEGMGNAFGGRLAFLAGEEATRTEPATTRVRSSVQRNHAEADDRRERMLGE